MNDLAFVCHSGDKNSWVWKYWIHYLKKNFTCKDVVDTVFICENGNDYIKDVSKKENIKLVLTGDNVCWGEGLIDALNRIDYKYVLFYHEDYLVEPGCDAAKLLELTRFAMYHNCNMIKCCGGWAGDPNWSASDAFGDSGLDVLIDGKPERMSVYNNKHEYTISHQACIWRKDFLTSTLKPEYSPWDHEIHGSIELSKRNEVLHVYRGSPPVPYSEVIGRGEVRPGCEKYFIEVDKLGY